MKRLFDWLEGVDWQSVGEWVGGIIITLALLGMVLDGGAHPGDWWAP